MENAVPYPRVITGAPGPHKTAVLYKSVVDLAEYDPDHPVLWFTSQHPPDIRGWLLAGWPQVGSSECADIDIRYRDEFSDNITATEISGVVQDMEDFPSAIIIEDLAWTVTVPELVGNYGSPLKMVPRLVDPSTGYTSGAFLLGDWHLLQDLWERELPPIWVVTPRREDFHPIVNRKGLPLLPLAWWSVNAQWGSVDLTHPIREGAKTIILDLPECLKPENDSQATSIFA